MSHDGVEETKGVYQPVHVTGEEEESDFAVDQMNPMLDQTNNTRQQLTRLVDDDGQGGYNMQQIVPAHERPSAGGGESKGPAGSQEVKLGAEVKAEETKKGADAAAAAAAGAAGAAAAAAAAGGRDAPDAAALRLESFRRRGKTVDGRETFNVRDQNVETTTAFNNKVKEFMSQADGDYSEDFVKDMWFDFQDEKKGGEKADHKAREEKAGPGGGKRRGGGQKRGKKVPQEKSFPVRSVAAFHLHTRTQSYTSVPL